MSIKYFWENSTSTKWKGLCSPLISLMICFKRISVLKWRRKIIMTNPDWRNCSIRWTNSTGYYAGSCWKKNNSYLGLKRHSESSGIWRTGKIINQWNRIKISIWKTSVKIRSKQLHCSQNFYYLLLLSTIRIWKSKRILSKKHYPIRKIRKINHNKITMPTSTNQFMNSTSLKFFSINSMKWFQKRKNNQ